MTLTQGFSVGDEASTPMDTKRTWLETLEVAASYANRLNTRIGASPPPPLVDEETVQSTPFVQVRSPIAPFDM